MTYSAKKKGLGYSPRDPHPVNHRVGAECARVASKPFHFDSSGFGHCTSKSNAWLSEMFYRTAASLIQNGADTFWHTCRCVGFIGE